MKVGDMIESAIWIDGTETKEQRKQFEAEITNAIDELCDTEGFLRGPVAFFEKLPLDDRVPAVPDHVSGPNVRLLAVEAAVVGIRPIESTGSFIANLEKKDLERLRALTRSGAKKYDRNVVLTDAECDEIIEELGPAAALDTLRQNVVVTQYH